MREVGLAGRHCPTRSHVCGILVVCSHGLLHPYPRHPRPDASLLLTMDCEGVQNHKLLKRKMR